MRLQLRINEMKQAELVAKKKAKESGTSSQHNAHFSTKLSSSQTTNRGQIESKEEIKQKLFPWENRRVSKDQMSKLIVPLVDI